MSGQSSLYWHMQQAVKNGWRLTGAARFFYLLCLSIILSPIANPALAQNLLTPLDLAQIGTPELAMRLLQQEEPDPSTQLPEWMQWNRKRIAILNQSQQWQELIRTTEQQPVELPPDYRNWLRGVRANALLAQGKAQEARQAVLPLIWGEETDESALSQWRHLIIQSYLTEGRGGDALTAMIRQQQDYGEQGRDIRLLRARVLLNNGNPADAHYLLQGLDADVERDALLLLCRLREGEETSALVKPLQELQKQKKIEPQTVSLLLAIEAEMADRQQSSFGKTAALESLFGRMRKAPVAAGLFTYTPDTLWEAYLKAGRDIGNREHLLLGDDEAWLNAALKLEKKQPVQARAIQALLAHQSESPEVREQAHGRFADALLKEEGGLELLRQLYLGSSRFGTAENLPAKVRYLLAEQAIREGDLGLASRLLAQLPEAPGKDDAFNWQLRRAKVFVLAGDIEQGIQLLNTLLEEAQVFEKEQMDRFMQVIFDLQKVGEHDAVLDLLNRVYLRTSDSEARRELLYWMADSRMEQKNYIEAARVYLHSAAYHGPNVMDPWAQTARYQAAVALTKAGLVADARRLYEQLLAVTKDPARRIVLTRDLEQLRLQP